MNHGTFELLTREEPLNVLLLILFVIGAIQGCRREAADELKPAVTCAKLGKLTAPVLLRRQQLSLKRSKPRTRKPLGRIYYYRSSPNLP